MRVPHAPYAVKIWLAVRDAMPEGLSPIDVHTLVKGEVEHRALSANLQRMRQGGYLCFEGSGFYGRWKVGPKMPPAAATPTAAGAVVKPVSSTTAQDLRTVASRVPNSVFALAAKAPRDLREMADATSQPMPLDAVAPAWLGRSA